MTLTAIVHKELSFAITIIANHNIDTMDTIKSKIVMSKFYGEIEFYSKVVDNLWSIFEEDRQKLTEPFFLLLSKSLIKMGMLKRAGSVIEWSLNKYKNITWQLEAVEYQVLKYHLNPTQNTKKNILENISYLSNKPMAIDQYPIFAHTLYAMGYYKKYFEIYDHIFQNIKLDELFPAAKSKFDSTKTLISMNEIIDILAKENIISFPVAGSLLGLVRDGKLFDHDKDADIGLFIENYEQVHHIVSSICKIEKFTAPAMVVAPKEQLIWNVPILDTLNGNATDLFFFYNEENHYNMGIYTTCDIVKWNFTPFELTINTFGGREYYTPDNYELYLDEMYGNGWKEPVIVWDSLLNSPNISSKSKNPVLYYALSRLLGSIADKKIKHFDNIRDTLRENWDYSFSKEAEENLNMIRQRLLEEEKSE